MPKRKPAAGPPPISEKAFQGQVMSLLRMLGWLAYHTYSSMRSQKGFPDICAVKGRRVLFIELKREAGYATAEQSTWLEALRAAGQEAYLWKPSHWNEILKVLKEGPR